MRRHPQAIDLSINFASQIISWCEVIHDLIHDQIEVREMPKNSGEDLKTVRLAPLPQPKSRPIKSFAQPRPAPKPPNHKMGGKTKLRPPT
jgi:hypothetical protein